MAEEGVIFTRRASGLVRELTWFDVLLWVIAGPAASGMTYYTVKFPGLYPGGDITFAFFLGGLMWTPIALLLAAFASSFPRTGAPYLVISRATHVTLGFIPIWLYAIGGGSALASGFLLYLSIIPLASGFGAAGIITHNSYFSGIASFLSDPSGFLTVGFIMVIVLWIIEYIGIKSLKWVMRVIVLLPLALTIFVILVFLIAGPSGAQTAWNNVFGRGTYQAILTAAPQNGLTYMDFGAATTGLLLIVLWAYSGLEGISFAGSEVKTPKTSFMRGYVYGLIAVIILYMLNAWTVSYAFGYKFIEDYSFLYYNSSSSYNALQTILGTTPAAPTVPFYASIILGNPYIAIVLGFAYWLWYINTIIIIWMAGVRGLFAMAFDRMIPTRFANINKRGSPTWANHFIGIFAFLGVVLGLMDYYSMSLASSVLALMDFTCLFFIWPLGLAGMLLPYTRPDLFEKSTFQYKIMGVPVMTILGTLTFAVGWYVMIMTATEEDIMAEILNIVLVTAGLLLLVYMWAKNQKEGIDPNKIFTEIPPA